MTILADRTVLPPTGGDEVTALQALAAMLGSDHPAELVDTTTGASQVIPEKVREVLRQVLAVMASDQAVTVTGTNTLLTTQKAAEVLGVSRPTLVRLLDSDQIPHTKPNRHRRVELKAVLDYQRRTAATRRTELDAMTREAAEDDGFATVNGFVTTR